MDPQFPYDASHASSLMLAPHRLAILLLGACTQQAKPPTPGAATPQPYMGGTPEPTPTPVVLLEEQTASLMVPGIDAAMEAGKLLENLPTLWEEADITERRHILMTMLDVVYVDTVEEKAVVAFRPKPAFIPLFLVATTREDSGVVLITEPPPDLEGPEASDSCSWWRRGGVELYLERGLAVLVAVSWGAMHPPLPRASPDSLLSPFAHNPVLCD